MIRNSTIYLKTVDRVCIWNIVDERPPWNSPHCFRPLPPSFSLSLLCSELLGSVDRIRTVYNLKPACGHSLTLLRSDKRQLFNLSVSKRPFLCFLPLCQSISMRKGLDSVSLICSGLIQMPFLVVLLILGPSQLKFTCEPSKCGQETNWALSCLLFFGPLGKYTYDNSFLKGPLELIRSPRIIGGSVKEFTFPEFRKLKRNSL